MHAVLFGQQEDLDQLRFEIKHEQKEIRDEISRIESIKKRYSGAIERFNKAQQEKRGALSVVPPTRHESEPMVIDSPPPVRATVHREAQAMFSKLLVMPCSGFEPKQRE